MKDIYQEWRSYENKHVLLRPVTMEDGKELLKVYSDKEARPLFNCDNFPVPCYFDTVEEMNREIQFYLNAYGTKDFVRWVIEWKMWGAEGNRNVVIGSLENLNKQVYQENGENWNSFHGVSLVRIDLMSEYEQEEVFQSVMELVLDTAYEDFHTTVIVTKAVPLAAVRRKVLMELGFHKSEENILGQNGQKFGDYYLKEME